ncbi:MAG: hypothetical protein K0R03_983 [Moraxellaceae bacterium]|jgi:hypothetical protein|nr:hypothetical protein [Moraxellaceae bacterium]
MKRWRMPLIAALLVALLLACFTVEYEEYDKGYSREAILNPWLAAGRLLEANGVRVRFTPEYSRLPPQARVLVLATPLQYLDFREQTELLAWVKDGGHLVTELAAGDEDDEGRNLIAGQLDVQRLQREPEDEKVMQDLPQQPRFLPVRLGDEGSVQAHFQPHGFLQAGRVAPVWEAKDRNGTHAMRFALGKGHVTLVSDNLWMHNMNLGEGDHAALLWRVIDAQRGEEAWLVHGMERPSLFALVLEEATPFLTALALAVLVWLWAISRRFGPLVSVLPTARRRLAEHLEASGRYLLRHGGLGQLHEASRQRLLAQVQRRHPQWRRLPSHELAVQLAARARIESGAVLRVLTTDSPDHLLQFAADIRLINRLRKAL